MSSEPQLVEEPGREQERCPKHTQALHPDKILGAGRIPPDEGFQFIAGNMKPSDVVSIGFGTEDEVSETVELAEKLF